MSANPTTAYNKVYDANTLSWVFMTQPIISGGTVVVGGTITLGAGSAAIGKLAANSGVDIGDVTITNESIAVTGPLTDAQLRDTAVPVSGPLTDAELRNSAVPVSGPLTDVQLRNTAVPVSGTVSVGNFPATQPVSAASLPLPSGAATSVSQATLEALVNTLQELVQRLAPLGGAMSSGAVGLRVVGVSMPSTAVTGPITNAQYVAENLTSKIALENMTAILGNVNNCTGA